MPFGYAEEKDFDLAKEQREDRVRYVLYGVGALLLVIGFLMNEQDRVWLPILDAFGLTTLCYGYAFYAHERQHVRKLWLWKAVLATIPLHLMFLAGLVWWDWRFPHLAHMGFVFAFVLLAACAVETALMKLIIDRVRPKPRSGPESVT